MANNVRPPHVCNVLIAEDGRDIGKEDHISIARTAAHEWTVNLMEIKPTDLLAVVRACTEVQNAHFKGGYRFADSVQENALKAVRLTYDAYIKQIEEQKTNGR